MNNPNKIPWLHYQDIQISDLDAYKSFSQAIISGNYEEALSLLQTYKNQLQGKAYISDIINKIVNGVKRLESYFNDGVNIYLTELALKHMKLVENFDKKGIWNNTIEYIPYNFVLYNKDVYMCIKKPPVGALPTVEEYWIKATAQGNNGAFGVNVNIRYQWESKKEYTAGDLVSYNGNLYIALKTNTNVKPDEDINSWLVFLLVAKGKIEIGENPPISPVQNTIWFKFESNPVATSSELIGQFCRYTSTGEWEDMYPSVLFKEIMGIDKYASYLNKTEITISPNDWKKINNNYIFNYKSLAILDSSHIEIYNASTNNTELYSTLSLKISQGQIELSTSKQPIKSLNVIMLIQ